MIDEKNLTFCTGCGVCASVCPVKCIEISLDENGFYKPVINTEKCTKCGLCDRVCTIDDALNEKEVLKSLSAYTKNEDTILSTSSGGVCYEISKWGLDNGYKVCAVIYNYEKQRAEHAVIVEKEQLEDAKGSKYFQSYTKDAFSQIYDGEKWVVIGTPCQIAAIDKAAKLRKIRDNYVLIDFFCHGTPSMHVWKNYLKDHNDKKIEKIGFRSKEFGWGKWSLNFTYSDGTKKSDSEGNLFYKLFFSNACLNDSCYNCHFKALSSAADIRVGDFWGKKHESNKKGVSGIIVFTEKGKDILNKTQEVFVLNDEAVDDVLDGQMFKSPEKPKVRKKLLTVLSKGKSLGYIYKVTLFPTRLKSVIKSKLRGR